MYKCYLSQIPSMLCAAEAKQYIFSTWALFERTFGGYRTVKCMPGSQASLDLGRIQSAYRRPTYCSLDKAEGRVACLPWMVGCSACSRWGCICPKGSVFQSGGRRVFLELALSLEVQVPLWHKACISS